MKKLIILFFLCFFLCGCYDYRELNNCYFVSGIAIDRENDEYEVTYEILDTVTYNEGKIQVVIASGTGKTISEAFMSVNQSLSKEATMSHIKIVLFSEEIAKSGILNSLSYLISSPRIRNNFYPFVVKGKAKDVFYLPNQENGFSSVIQNMLDFNEEAQGYISKQVFSSFLDSIMDPRSDGFINVLEIIDDKAEITSLGLFFKDKLVAFLDKNEAALLLLIKNKSKVFYYDIAGNDCFTVLNVYNNQDISILPQDGNVLIKTKLLSSIIEDTCQYDLKNKAAFDELAKQSESYLSNSFNKLWKKLQDSNSDALGITKMYYTSTRIDIKSWSNLDIKLELDVSINKNGTLFEVKDHV